MLASIGIQIRLGRANWNKFWRRLRSHKEKTKKILGFDYLFSPDRSDDSDVYEYLKDIAERLHAYEDLKLVALYSDCSEGMFHSPDEIIEHDIACAFLKLAKGRLRAIEEIEKITAGKIKNIDIEKVKAFGKKLGLIDEDL